MVGICFHPLSKGRWRILEAVVINAELSRQTAKVPRTAMARIRAALKRGCARSPHVLAGEIGAVSKF